LAYEETFYTLFGNHLRVSKEGLGTDKPIAQPNCQFSLNLVWCWAIERYHRALVGNCQVSELKWPQHRTPVWDR